MRNSSEKYNMVAETFWANVTSIMKEKHMTWAELAGLIGTDKSTLTTRKCYNNCVSIGSAKDIAEALGVGIDRLIYSTPTIDKKKGKHTRSDTALNI